MHMHVEYESEREHHRDDEDDFHLAPEFVELAIEHERLMLDFEQRHRAKIATLPEALRRRALLDLDRFLGRSARF